MIYNCLLSTMRGRILLPTSPRLCPHPQRRSCGIVHNVVTVRKGIRTGTLNGTVYTRLRVRSQSDKAHRITTSPPSNLQTQQLATPKDTAIVPLWVSKHPGVIAAVPVLGNLAYITLASGFLCSDVLSLRLLLICGYSGLVTFHALRPRPLLIPLGWSAFFVIVNASMAVLLFRDQMAPTLTEEEEERHVQHFAPLSLKQFRALMDIGTRKKYNDGDFLTTANQPCNKLFFILKGNATMTSSTGEHISTLQEGSFPNCMSFQRSGWDSRRRSLDDRSYSTIRCEGEVECVVWESEDLLYLLDNAPGSSVGSDDMRLRMDHVVIEAVMRRLLLDPEGANVKDYLRVISQGWAHEVVQERKLQTMRTVPIDEEDD